MNLRKENLRNAMTSSAWAWMLVYYTEGFLDVAFDRANDFDEDLAVQPCYL